MIGNNSLCIWDKSVTDSAAANAIITQTHCSGTLCCVVSCSFISGMSVYVCVYMTLFYIGNVC